MPVDVERYDNLWWNSDKGKVFENLFQQVVEIVTRQGATYDRFVKLEASYDPNNLAVANAFAEPIAQDITENVIASNVDTVTAEIAATDVGTVVQTTGGQWSEQRLAKHLTWYGEELSALYDVNGLAAEGARSGAKKGSGFVFVTLDQWRMIHVDRVAPDDVVVDELETRYGERPRHLVRRKNNVSKEQLKAEFPKCAEQIDEAGGGRGRDYLRRGGYLVSRSRELVECEAWFLPIGRKGGTGYKPGRHVRCIDGCDLLDEEWDKDHFPCEKYDWTPREGGYFGISLAERIWGHQRVVNKRHWQADRIIDQHASPTRWFRMPDANLMVQTHDLLGQYGIVKADYPQLDVPQPVSPQIFEHMDMMSQKAFRESGVSQMAAQAMKPAGLDSGAALRAYHDHTSARFSLQEEAYEDFVVGIMFLLYEACKELGDAAPKLLQGTKWGDRDIDWSKVDLRWLRVNLKARSTLNDSEAGREQQVLEWAQAGVITMDEFRRLVGHPDLEREMSLYTAAEEHVEWCIEQIADGVDIVPEPFANLKMLVWKGQMQYLNWTTAKAPERVLEELRAFVAIAAYQAGQAEGLVANGNAGAAADPTQQPGVPGTPPMAPAPSAGPATAALSPQAMQLVAGTG